MPVSEGGGGELVLEGGVHAVRVRSRGFWAKVARWQNLIPSFPWITPGWRAWGRNPRNGRDQILQRSVAEPLLHGSANFVPFKSQTVFP